MSGHSEIVAETTNRCVGAAVDLEKTFTVQSWSIAPREYLGRDRQPRGSRGILLKVTEHQAQIDTQNARFWSELCGSSLARTLGITAFNNDGPRKFDPAYMEMYPYLWQYLDRDFSHQHVLEIGLGFGTLGYYIAARGATYCGVDVAPEPVAMMRRRLIQLDRPDRITRASALALPFPDEAFDCVYSIGCLHHTGDLTKATAEVHRVTKRGGRAVVMLYNNHSLRRLLRVPLRYGKTADARGVAERARYDADIDGKAAPHTDFVSRRQVRRLFSPFAKVSIHAQNMDPISLLGGRFTVTRERLLSNLARVVGLDLYIVAMR